MVKKNLGPEAKKEYTKPEVTRNEPLVDITFATAGAGTATFGTPTPTTLTGTGGTPGGVFGKGGPGMTGGADGPTLIGGAGIEDGDTLGGELDDSGTATIVGSGTLIPGTGGAPGTIL